MKILIKIILIALFGYVPLQSHAEGFTLSSPHISGQLPLDQILDGCGGKNTSPKLKWHSIPKGTKSFAVTAYDPDAPTGSGFWHWVAFNIPADVKGLKERAGDVDSGRAPDGMVQSLNSAGGFGFTGACPPEGEGFHRYVFTVFALDTMLDLKPSDQPAWVGYHLNKHAIAKSSLVAYAKR